MKFTQQQYRPGEVCSGRPQACLYESSVTFRSNQRSCPVSEQCQSSSTLLSLSAAYGTGVIATLSEPSASPVVRVESVFNDAMEDRGAIRKHFFEHICTTVESKYEIAEAIVEALRAHLLASKYPIQSIQEYCDCILEGGDKVMHGDVARAYLQLCLERANVPKDLHRDFLQLTKRVLSSPFQCFHRVKEAVLGRYLGFVDLRLNSQIASVALSLLVIPRQYRHDPRTTIINGSYGEIFGGHNFECSIFAMQDPAVSDGKCVQTCVVMLLAMFSDRGAKVIGTLDISSRCKSQRCTEEFFASQSNQGLVPENLGVESISRIGGMLVSHACEAINASPGLGVWSEIYEVHLYKKGVNEAAERHLFARMVDACIQARCPVMVFVEGKNTNHCCIIVGVTRNLGRSRAPTHYIYHDPSCAPFLSKSHDELIASMCKLRLESTGERAPPTLCALFAYPENIKHGVWNCILRLRAINHAFLRKFVVPIASESRVADFEIRLLHSSDVSSFIRRSYTAHKQSVKLPSLEKGWYWCFFGLRNNIVLDGVFVSAEHEVFEPKSLELLD